MFESFKLIHPQTIYVSCVLLKPKIMRVHWSMIYEPNYLSSENWTKENRKIMVRMFDFASTVIYLCSLIFFIIVIVFMFCFNSLRLQPKLLLLKFFIHLLSCLCEKLLLLSEQFLFCYSEIFKPCRLTSALGSSLLAIIQYVQCVSLKVIESQLIQGIQYMLSRNCFLILLITDLVSFRTYEMDEFSATVED